MQQFDLSLWLKDKSRKVVTRDGRPVRIVCWDRKYDHNDFPIIALEDWDNGEYVNFVSSNGKVDLSGSENIHDLFFADKEEELTEFECGLFSLVSEFWQRYALLKEEVDIAELVKENSKELLDLARKEILKDLPKWKKCVGSTGPFIDDFRGEDYLYLKDYVIKVSELFEKLPKKE